MYTREQTSQLRQEFWTTFGQYMSPVLSAEGGKINWLNYKTGIKHVHFKMDADKKSARIAIEISHPDIGIQELFFNQFEEFSLLLKDSLQEDWEWQLHCADEYGKTVTRIEKVKHNVNVFNKENWPELIAFFKPRIIALDEFWVNVKEGFEALK